MVITYYQDKICEIVFNLEYSYIIKTDKGLLMVPKESLKF